MVVLAKRLEVGIVARPPIPQGVPQTRMKPDIVCLVLANAPTSHLAAFVSMQTS